MFPKAALTVFAALSLAGQSLAAAAYSVQTIDANASKLEHSFALRKAGHPC